MTLYEAADLEMMRTAQEEALPDSCAVKRRVSTANTTGGHVDTYPTTTYTYPCRLSVSGVPSAYLALAAERHQTPVMVTFAHDADVLISDRLVIGGRTLSILGFASGGAWLTALRVVAVEVA
jgi:hypothetical protein